MITAEEKVFSISDLRFIILSFYLEKRIYRKKKISKFKKIKNKISSKFDSCLFYIILRIWRYLY